MARLREGNPDRICIHHSAVAPGAKDLSELKKRCASYEVTHSKKTWAETIKTAGEYGYYYVEYHTAIARNGHELRLQDDKYVLYHAGDNARGKDSFNLHGTALLIDGNYETENYTPEQLEGTGRYIARFQKKYKVDVIVRGHKETSLSATACPGKNLGTHDSGFIKLAIARANEIIKNNLPTNPIQEDKPVEPPVPPELIACQKEVEGLKTQIDSLTGAVGALEGDKKVLGERVEFLESTLAVRDGELKDLEKNYDRVLEERNGFEQQYLSTVKELNELKEGRDDWINRLADVLHKLFGMK